MESSWKAKRNELYRLIKLVSDHYGGDDIDWLREYAKDIVKTHEDFIETAISCFGDLCSGLGIKLNGERLNDFKQVENIYSCKTCGLVPPFCRFDLDGQCHNIWMCNKLHNLE